MTKNASKDPFFLSESVINYFDKIGILAYLSLKKHIFKNQIEGFEEFIAYELQDLDDSQFLFLDSLLNIKLNEKSKISIVPVKSWVDFYKQLEGRNNIENPKSSFMEALFKIFVSFGFKLKSGDRITQDLIILFYLVMDAQEIGVICLDYFSSPAITHYLSRLIEKKKVGRILFLVSELGQLNDSNIHMFFPKELSTKFVILSINELKYLHSLFQNIPEIKKEIISPVFFTQSHVVDLNKVESFRKELLTKTLLKRIQSLKGVFSKESKIISMIDGDASIKEIGEVVKSEYPILAQRVLRYNNSALSQFTKTQNIVRATINNGSNAVRDILYSEMAKKTIPKTFPGYGILPGTYLTHCKMTGIFCDFIAKKLKIKCKYRIDGKEKTIDSFYSLGFLHDIGICFLDQAIQRFYRDIILEGGDQYFTYQENEEKHGIFHAQWSNVILGQMELSDGHQAWALPLPILEGIYYHHTPYDLPKNKDTTTKFVANLLFICECLFECYHLNSIKAYNVSKEYFSEAQKVIGLSFEELMKIYDKTEKCIELF